MADRLGFSPCPAWSPGKKHSYSSSWGPLALTVWGAGLAAVWAYWPALATIVGSWWRTADYAHGFLVAPVAASILWLRRDRFPAADVHPGGGGLWLLAASVAMRLASGLGYYRWLDGWSILAWLGGMVWLAAGWKVLRWAAPGILYLFFMMPLPWRVEELLGRPLAEASAVGGAWVLVCLDQPAVSAGSTILLGSERLDVARACAGMRTFFGIAAMAAAYVLVCRRPWWQQLLIVAAALPAAVVANVLRVAATGIVVGWTPQAGAREAAHQLAGWGMIPLAAVLLAGVVVWLDRVFCRVEPATPGELTRAG